VGRIPEETIEAIRSRVDLVDLIGRSVALKPAGRSFKGLCPFHHEKTPSFHVNPQLGIFHCFGCQAGGNAFAFVMRHDNLTFPEAVRALGRVCGIEVPESDESGEGAGLGRRMREACEVAARFYRETLRGPEGEAARAYVARRGLDAEAMARFGLGLAPEGWDALARALAAARIPGDLAERAGLLAEGRRGGHYDRLRGRLIFPIRDVRGDVVAFGGRALPDAAGASPEPKYLNTPESALFRKREAFYGIPDALEAIRRQGRAVVVEGYFDRIALARAGVDEALATCGTALTQDHARQLRRRTGCVVLLFDGDEAGQRAVERSLELLLPEGLRVRAAALPAGDDPDTFLAREGPEALRELVASAPPAFEIVIRRAVAGGCATAWEKADAVGAVVPLLVRVPDPVERGETARQLAFAAGVPARDVEAALRRAHAQQRGSQGDGEDPRPVEPRSRVESSESRWARGLARLLLQFPALARALDVEELAGLVPAPWDQVLPALASRLAEHPDADVSELTERLGDEAGRALREVAVEGLAAEGAEAARSAVRDTILRLRQRRWSEEEQELTQRLRQATTETEQTEILVEKQRLQERRRRAQAAVSSAPSITQ
jgi:DNA primase